ARPARPRIRGGGAAQGGLAAWPALEFGELAQLRHVAEPFGALDLHRRCPGIGVVQRGRLDVGDPGTHRLVEIVQPGATGTAEIAFGATGSVPADWFARGDREALLRHGDPRNRRSARRAAAVLALA